jgi:hypothetical protein
MAWDGERRPHINLNSSHACGHQPGHGRYEKILYFPPFKETRGGLPDVSIPRQEHGGVRVTPPKLYNLHLHRLWY